jgi:hypothetical protein
MFHDNLLLRKFLQKVKKSPLPALERIAPLKLYIQKVPIEPILQVNEIWEECSLNQAFTIR